MKKKVFLLGFAIIAIGGSALLGAENASAVVAPLDTTDTLSVISADGSQNFDVSDSSDNSWYERIVDSDYTGTCSYVSELSVAYNDRETYGISVTQLVGNALSESGSRDYQLGVYVTWSIVTPRSQTITDGGDYPNTQLYNDQNTGYFGMMWVDNSGNYQFGCNALNYSSCSGSQCSPLWSRSFVAGNVGAPFGVTGYLYYSSWTINYPMDYEGDVVPDEPSVPPETSDYVPNFYVSVANKWRASIHDTNFNTFDGVPFTCSEGLAPVLNWEIWDLNVDPEVMLSSGVQNATSQIDYQFPENDSDQDYRVVGWYDCGEAPEIQFTESSFFDFTINGLGSLYTLGLETCLVDGFPFFDMEACLVGVNSTLALLSFNIMNPDNESLVTVAQSNPNNCHTLGTLGDWLNSPEMELCPAYTSTIRNIVTPFVTFATAGTIIFFLSRSKGMVID